MKKLLGVIGVAGALSIGVAQAEISLPEISASLEGGVRSTTGGKFGEGDNRTLIGPYTRPGLTLTFNTDTFQVLAAYELWLYGGKAFGPGTAATEETPAKDMGDNFTFVHYPYWSIGANLPNNMNVRLLGEYWYQNNSDPANQAGNISSLALIPTVGGPLTSRITWNAAYNYIRTQGLNPERPSVGSVLGDLGGGEGFAKLMQEDQQDAMEKLEKQFEQALKQAAASGIPGIESSHQASVGLGITVTDRITWNTHLRGGREFRNLDRTDRNVSRVQNEVIAQITPKLTGRVRHRMFYNREVEGPAWTLNNRLRLIAQYGISEQVKLYFENEGQMTSEVNNVGAGQPTSYSNTNYLGLVYSF